MEPAVQYVFCLRSYSGYAGGDFQQTSSSWAQRKPECNTLDRELQNFGMKIAGENCGTEFTWGAEQDK